MRLFRNTPIRRKLMTVLLLISGAVMLLTCASFIGYELLTYRGNAVQQISTLGEIIAAQSTGAVAFDNPRDATEVLSALKAEPNIVAACIYDENGRIFARYVAFGKSYPALPSAPAGDGCRFEGAYLVGFTPIVQTQGSQRFGTLYLCSNMEALRDRLHLYGLISLGVILIVSLVAYLLSRWLQRQISEPILALAGTARAVSEHNDYSVRATRQDEDEIGALTDAFNHMLAEIEKQNEELEHRVFERTRELESANDELEAFCSSAAHDLRTPLRAITGFSDLLLDERRALGRPETQRYVQLIRDGSCQMSTLINDLLAFSRLGRQEIRRRQVDLTTMVREVYRDLGHEWQGRDISFQVADLPQVQGDPSLLRVVLNNLLSNAIKYTRPRAKAWIHVGVEEGGTGQAGTPVFFIADNGVGFDMADMDRLFGVFQRLHHASEFEGTGVGLATVRRIIDRHGGRIWAEAKPDQGATFYFTLS